MRITAKSAAKNTRRVSGKSGWVVTHLDVGDGGIIDVLGCHLYQSNQLCGIVPCANS